VLFPITTVALAACLVWTYSRGERRSAMLLALWVWAVGIALMSAPLFTYRVDYAAAVDAFVALCLAATTLGYHVLRKRPRPVPQSSSERGREIALARVLSGLGILGCLLQLGGAVAGGTQLSVAYLLQNLTVIRDTAFDQAADSRSSPLGFVDGYLASFSFLSVIAVARLGMAGGRSLVLLGVANFVLAALVGLFLTGGRTTLFYALLLVLVSLYLSGRRLTVLNPRALLAAAATLVLVAYFSVSFLDTRSGVSDDPERVLEHTQRAEYRPWVARAAQANPVLATTLVSIGYFGSPLPTLSYYLQRKPVPGPYWGAYSYPLPARVSAAVAGTTPKSLATIREEVFDPLESAGYSGNVWATWLRDLVIDFGYSGAVVFCALFGAFMAWARNRFELTGALHYHTFEVMACFTLAFGAFASVLPFALLASAFFTAFAVMFAMRVRFTQSTAAPAHRRPRPVPGP
jgi:hypothetical protein